MKNNLLNEIKEIKYLFNYDRGRILSEQTTPPSSSTISAPEKRARDAYKLMIAGASGIGTEPKKFRDGIDILQSADEFYRMNSLFADGKTGYKSFDEMWRGELEFGRIGNNVGTAKHIIAKLKQISVPYSTGKNRYLKDFALVNTKSINKPLSEPAPAPAASAPAATQKTPTPNRDYWEDVKKYYKDNQNVDSENKEDDNFTWEQIKVKGDNNRTYIFTNNGGILGVDEKYYRGNWSWDGSKPVMELYRTKREETTGYVNDSDTDWEAVSEDGKVMGIGAKGDLVRKLQQKLIQDGYADGLNITSDIEGCKTDMKKCDGIYGKETQKAVKKAQQALEIDDDGVVGDETYTALM